MIVKLFILLLISFQFVFSQNEHVPRYGPRNRPQKFTLEQLKQYDGSDPDVPIYLAIKGKVFDVTAGRSHYGPGMGYSWFAGRDASASFATGCYHENCEKKTYDDLTNDEKKSVDDWESFYLNHAEYFYVGEVVYHQREPSKPVKEETPKSEL